MWKYGTDTIASSEFLLYSSLIEMLEFDDDVFAAGNCYDQQEYGAYNLFCPYAYRLPNGSILAKDLAAEYDYMAPSSTWFYNARRKGEEIIQLNTPILRGGRHSTATLDKWRITRS
jgi:G protein-coupled receptor 158